MADQLIKGKNFVTYSKREVGTGFLDRQFGGIQLTAINDVSIYDIITKDFETGTSIEILLDMTVPVTVAVGQTEITVQRLLQLGPGSVLKLEKTIETPADLYLKNTKFATGNIVVIDNRFGIRIKEILGTGVEA